MSRSLTAGMITEVTAPSLMPAILLKAEFDGGDVRFWTGIGSLTYDSEVYTGAGNLLGFSEIEETTNVEAKGVNFQLSGIPSSLISTALSENYQGRYITAWFACFDTAGALIADPYQIFKGRMDVLEIAEGADTATLTMRSENKLIDLKRARVRRYTPEDQKAFYPNDTGLYYVSALQDKEIIWGQKSPS